MAHKIEGTLYRIKGLSGVPHYVECESENDLFLHLINEWILKGYPVQAVNRLDHNGTTPKIAIYSNKEFKTLLQKSKGRKENQI